MTTDGLRAFGELYAEVRQRGVRFSTHLSENARPGDGEVAEVQKRFRVRRYLDVYDGRFLEGSARGGRKLMKDRAG